MTDSRPLDPLTVQKVQDQKNALLEAERSNIAELTGSWLNMEATLFSDMEALASEVYIARSLGKKITLDYLLNSSTYQRLVASAQSQLSGFLNFAENNILGNQRFYGGLAISDAAESVSLGLAEWGRFDSFFQLHESLVDDLVGLAGNKKSIRSLLDPTRPDAIYNMTRYLLENQKLAPADLIRKMQDGLGFGYNRVLNTSRTESFRVYREMVLRQWRESNLVRGYKRVTAHDLNVCPGCLADEGHFYTLEETMPTHPQDRCQGVPWIKGLPEPTWLAGEDWFRTLDDNSQISILGPGRWDAWVSGKYSFRDLTSISTSPEWGDSVKSTNLRDLIPAEQ